MTFQTKIACTALAAAMLFSAAGAVSASAADGSDALIELLSVKGIITREEGAQLREKAASPAGGSFDAVVELLQRKGTISREEADTLLKQQAARDAKEMVTGETVAKGKSAEPVIEPAPRLPEKEIKPVIDVLREQGVLGADESEQIRERIGKKWSPSEEDDFIALEGQEIEYSRSTLPRESMLAYIEKLQQQGLVSADEAERVRARYLQKASLERVTDSIGENFQRDMRMEIAGRIIPVPEWTRRIKLAGDLRLRYRADMFDENNAQIPRPDTNTFTFFNSTVDRYYTQVRARLALTAKVTDDVEAGIRLATGNTTNPVSTNATLGDTLNKKSFLLDQAYLKWAPLPGLTVWGGRFENPWFGTDLVWDPDINFDGLAMSWKQDLGSGLNLFATAGAFPIEEVELSSHDKWLYGGQIGVNYKQSDRLTATLAAAYYYFDNITGKPNSDVFKGATDWSRPKFQQKGNSTFYLDPNNNVAFEGYQGLAAEFKELNITTKIDYALDDAHRVTLTGDYVNNIGYNAARVNARVSTNSADPVALIKETEGFLIGLSAGTTDVRDIWDWRVLLNYKYLEADAVVDGFTESDFHLGGTNAKGWIIGADLGLAKNVWLNTRWFTANEITGLPYAIDVFQLNLNAKF